MNKKPHSNTTEEEATANSSERIIPIDDRDASMASETRANSEEMARNADNHAEHSKHNDHSDHSDHTHHVTDGEENAGAAEEGVESEDLENLAEAVEALEEKLAEYETIIKRQQAEFDNYRKRTLEERQKLLKYAPEAFIQKLFPLLNHYEQALGHQEVESDPKIKSFLEGFSIIKQQFDALLTEFNVRPSTQIGDVFNPNLHQAVMIETPESDTSNPSDNTLTDTSQNNTRHHAENNAKDTNDTKNAKTTNHKHPAKAMHKESNAKHAEKRTPTDDDPNIVSEAKEHGTQNTVETVSEIFEQGYLFHDRVIKVAHVKVLQPKKTIPPPTSNHQANQPTSQK